MWKEFKEFALKGSFVDLAVGVVIGGAFGKIVSSFVDDLINPLVGLVTGKVPFADKFISLNGEFYPTLEAAKKAGVPTLNYGLFVNNILTFLITAFAIFILIKVVNKLRRAQEDASTPPTKQEELLIEIRDLLMQSKQS